MTYQRLAYDDASSPAEMSADCRAVDLAMHLPRQVGRVTRTALGVVPAPPEPVRRVSFAVSDAAARLAGRFTD